MRGKGVLGGVDVVVGLRRDGGHGGGKVVAQERVLRRRNGGVRGEQA